MKVGLSPSKNVSFICFNGGPSKVMKNTFYFILKALFLRYLNLRPDFFSHVGKWLDKKTKVHLNIYDVTDWETNNYITQISQYLKKLRPPKVGGEASPIPINKKSKLSIFPDQQSEMLYSLFLFKSKWRSTTCFDLI